MDYLDTQIISYVFKRNKDMYDKGIKGKKISSIVALEFLGIMIKGTNGAKLYPIKLLINHDGVYHKIDHRKKGFEIGRKLTDKLVIDFFGNSDERFDSIIIYSNEAICDLINSKDLASLFFFARNTLDKEEFKRFKERAQFLVDNELIVTPITEDTVNLMHSIYEQIKDDYNIKNDYRNSFMDLLIVAKAVEDNERLISQDKELNKVLAKCLNVQTDSKGISVIEKICEKETLPERRETKGYVNNGWRVMVKRGYDINSL